MQPSTPDPAAGNAGPILDVPQDLLAKYDRVGPRYTSYPTAPAWKEDFDGDAWRIALSHADAKVDAPMGMYVHIPFCVHRCLFCACNVIISKRQDIVEQYLDRLELEIQRAAELLPKRRQISGLHWGGGTPTHLSVEQIQRVMGMIEKHFQLLPDAEVSIEVHPPVTTREQLQALYDLGFRRLSLGVQDLDWEVQQLIGRNQTLQQTEDVLDIARELGFESVNFDLIYGLPGQTAATWDFTLDQVLRMRPDRLAIYSYAHVPWLHPHQERMPADQMPGPELKLHMIRRCKQRLAGDGGYIEIGFDHFATPEDSMAKAVNKHRLYRNFMGYTVKPGEDYIGFGVSAISEVGGSFLQNHSKLNRWNQAIDKSECTVHRGLQLSTDDRVRKLIIERLMCNLWLDLTEVETYLELPFKQCFADAWQALAEMEADGLVVRGETWLQITPLGRTFLRNVCMLFDAYLPEQEGQRFSRTV
ncbi:MAG: oxygen-independent coproporphyrinogen III oxidase [Planctomycetes bacterium]|nr:oxygen-independent coproporphyrinogen III oxidase [Planctomycetota bacterium]